ncbi:MAG TPA: phosphatase PAP2 family protein [Solirubrobacteraceae bacterium]|nr:phosphatase PAP2 family protein [Solirubrobacteraceae bacterium]
MLTTRFIQIARRSQIPAVALLVAGWLLLLLAGYVAGRLVTDAAPAWDARIGAAIHGTRGTPLTHAMQAISALGSPVVLDTVFISVITFLLVQRRVQDVRFLALASSGAVLLERLLKQLVDRPRPAGTHLVSAHGPSWPSGHASSTLALYGALLILALADRRERGHESRRVLRALIAAGAALVVLIGLSRIYLGVHNPSDVTAGWIISGTWLTMLTVITRHPQRWCRKGRLTGAEGPGTTSPGQRQRNAHLAAFPPIVPSHT